MLQYKTAGSFGKNIVVEDNEAMTNAYYIPDSECMFIDNKTGKRILSLAIYLVYLTISLQCQ